jgi:YfiH family protein
MRLVGRPSVADGDFFAEFNQRIDGIRTMVQPFLMQFASLCSIPGLSHAIVAKPCNLAPHTGPKQELAVSRRQEVCAALGLDFSRLTCPQQVHGTNVAKVDASNAGAGREGRDTALADCDGVMTDLPGVPLVAFSADCCLLVIVDPAARAVGLTHVGWRGVAGGGAQVLVERMQEAYGARPERMVAAIAPAAQPCCYEISEDLARELIVSPYCGASVLTHSADKWYLDMHSALANQLRRCGLPAAQIERSRECTICDGRFFSYRREGATTGRNAIVVGWTQ